MVSFEPLLDQAPLEESSGPTSTTVNGDDAPRSLGFRDTLIRMMSGNLFLPPLSTAEPPKTSMKSYDVGNLAIDRDSLERPPMRNYVECENEFTCDFGLSEVMAQRVKSKCSSTYQIMVLLDSGPTMKRNDSISIEGKKKREGTGLPSDKRLARNVDYDIKLKTCPRYTALQDVSFFFVHLAVAMATPTTFELLTPDHASGRGRGYRRIGGSKVADGRVSRPEDFIPLGDQAESAGEMIDNFASLLTKDVDGSMRAIKEVKNFYDTEQTEITKQGENVLVVIITALLPWGTKRGDASDKETFVGLLNDFADLPVTFVFILETPVADIIQFYDDLISPQSGVRADVKVAKGLGTMLNGIQVNNPWLNYCLPVHLCQVLGICSNVLSHAANRPLRADEVRELCDTLVGQVPDPEEDMDAFLGVVKSLMSNEEFTRWNPAKGHDAPLIDITELESHLSGKFGCCHRCLACFRK